jgi:hypothetical protein
MLAVEIFGLFQRQTRPGNSSETCSIELSTIPYYTIEPSS